MPTRLLIAALALALALFGPDGEEAGRRGNALYRQGRYAAAAEAYRAGLKARSGEGSAVTARLWNNLGAALHQMGRHDEAQAAFAKALAAAQGVSSLARAAYNAGNNAVARSRGRAALTFYRKALLADPSNERARFNYEYLKRHLQQRRQKRGRRSSRERRRSSASHQKKGRKAGSSGRERRRPDKGRRRQEKQHRQEKQRAPNEPSTPRGQSASRPQANRKQQADRRRNDARAAHDQRPTRQEHKREADPESAREGKRREKLTRAQALRLLRALAERERKLVPPARKTKSTPRQVEKDW